MQRFSIVLAATLGIFMPAFTNRASAQGIGADPFTMYYSWYLPNQAAVATRPTPLDTINAMTAVRQQSAMAERPGLYDPISPFAEEDSDPMRPYSSRRGGNDPVARGGGSFSGRPADHVTKGTGPQLYYNRTARYHPSMRLGRGPNRNLAVLKNSRIPGGAGGGGSMPSMPGMGMPGMR